MPHLDSLRSEINIQIAATRVTLCEREWEFARRDTRDFIGLFIRSSRAAPRMERCSRRVRIS